MTSADTGLGNDDNRYRDSKGGLGSKNLPIIYLPPPTQPLRLPAFLLNGTNAFSVQLDNQNHETDSKNHRLNTLTNYIAFLACMLMACNLSDTDREALTQVNMSQMEIAGAIAAMISAFSVYVAMIANGAREIDWGPWKKIAQQREK